MAGWESWSELHQAYVGPWRDLVHHSGRVLQSLSFAPTGAICAAATTSLPEAVGGTRNWDYRYAWVRDASFTIQALWVAACPDEANEFFDYVSSSAAGSLEHGGDLQIMFGIGGERDLSERELPHLEGWRHSAPVRIGNAAWKQRQLDVYGELLDAVYRMSDHLFDNTHRVGPLSDSGKWDTPTDLAPATREFLVQLADTAARRWQEKDQGIWEIRGEPRDFLYSKLMCWVALDRAVILADRLNASYRIESWTQTREQIREAIMTKGWSDRANAFTQSFGSDELDASNLMVPLVGFLPADDPRVLATIDATEERLTDERGLVYRYRSHDGLEGEEGTFLLCTFWLAQALALAGQPLRARAVFERAAAFVNDVGLLAEEVDPVSGELLGNFPQAFSHIGLVNAAWAISESERRDDDRVSIGWPSRGIFEATPVEFERRTRGALQVQGARLGATILRDQTEESPDEHRPRTEWRSRRVTEQRAGRPEARGGRHPGGRRRSLQGVLLRPRMEARRRLLLRQRVPGRAIHATGIAVLCAVRHPHHGCATRIGPWPVPDRVRHRGRARRTRQSGSEGQ